MIHHFSVMQGGNEGFSGNVTLGVDDMNIQRV